MSVCNTGDNTPVMEINDTAVVPHIIVLQKKIREIGTPFLIDFIRSEILFQLVFKHFMRFPEHARYQARETFNTKAKNYTSKKS